MSENENTTEETTAEEVQANETPVTETPAAEKPAASESTAQREPARRDDRRDDRRGGRDDRRDDRRGGGGRFGGRDDRRGGGGRFGGRDDRREVSNVYTGGAPADYVRPQYRGRSRRVEGSININDVHYRNIPLLSKFLDPFGRIMSRRKTRVSAKVQRKAVKAIKQARHLCLLPYTGEHMRIARKRRRR